MKAFLAILALASLTACGDKEKVIVKEVPMAASAPVEVRPSIDQALAAVSRNNPDAELVCYDVENDRFFFKFPKKDPDSNVLEGWHWHGSFKMVHMANDTWTAEDDLNGNNYFPSVPDTANLPCKVPSR